MIQCLDEKPMVFFRFEELPEHTFCLINGEYIVTKESAVAYFFSHFFKSVASAKVTAKLNSESEEVCKKISENNDSFAYGIYYNRAWETVQKMQNKYNPKDVLGWALEKNIKVI